MSAEKRRPPLPPVVMVVLMVMCALLFGAWSEKSGGQAPVVFRFAPPDGTKYIETTVATREQEAEGFGRRVEQSKSKKSISIERSPTGYVITATPISMETTRDGKSVQEPVSDILKDVVVTYHVGPDGRMLKIDGYGGLLKKLSGAVPPQRAVGLAPMLSEDTLVARDMANWNDRIGGLVSTTVSMGDSRDTQVPHRLPNGRSVTLHTRTSFAGMEPCASRDCVRVRVRYDSDPNGLDEEFSGSDPSMKAGQTDTNPSPGSDFRISGSISRLIDPDTMLLHEETQSLVMSSTVQVPGQGSVPRIMKEERRYSFEYQ